MKIHMHSYIDDEYFHNKFIEYWDLMNEKERDDNEEIEKEEEKKDVSEDKK